MYDRRAKPGKHDRRAKKPAWKSRTIALNLIAITFATVEINMHLLQGLLGSDAWPIFSLIVFIGNAWLRFLTNQGLTLEDE